MRLQAISMLATVVLSACGQAEVNPPDQPAPPVQSPEALRAVEPPGLSSLANRGPASFVGLWAGNAAWCAAPQGAERPIRITPLRFEGYENSCDIARITEVAGGYDADLRCQAEGRTRTERVRLMTSGDMLTILYLDRDGASAKLGRCPGSPKPAEAASPLAAMMKKAPPT